MSAKDLIKDKSIDAAKYVASKSGDTMRGVGRSTGDLARTTSNIIVNHSSDPYDRLDDVAVDGAKQLSSHTVMGARNVWRTGRSLNNIRKKSKIKKIWLQKEWLRLSEEKKEDILKSKGITNKKSASIEEINKAKQKWGKTIWEKRKNKEKWSEYQKGGIRKGINISGSTKGMISNQSRKLINHISHNEDFSTKIIGKAAKSGWATWRYRNQYKNIYSAVKKTALVLKASIMGVISFVASIPAMVATIVSIIPVILILIVVIVVTSFFSDLEYTGRIHNFTENEVYLEYRNNVNVAPDEVLAITSVLGWNKQDLENYEALFALLYNSKDNDDKLSFDDMCNNIFIKYNPSSYRFKENTLEFETTGSWFGEMKTGYITRELYQKLYPKYFNGSKTDKLNYGTDANITKMKQKAKDALEINAKNYIATYLNDTEIFKADPLALDSISPNSATFHMGIRNLLKDKEFHSGVDIAASKGTLVYSVVDGEVVHSQSNITASGDICAKKGTKKKCGSQLGGNQVVLKTKAYNKDGDQVYLYIAYFHLNNATVKTGQIVNAGQEIGTVGETGMAFGSHLHLQAWTDIKSYSGSNYKMPYTTVTQDFNLWQKYIDASMPCSIEFKNKIYNR